MTIGRSKSVGSETRSSVSWKVECVPNRRKNCLGWTSREAGHSRVPAPPHMINGTIRPPIGTSNPVVVAIPGHKAANALFHRSLRPESSVAHQVADVGEGLQDVAHLHRQQILYGRTAQLLLQKVYHTAKLLRVLGANIVNPRRSATSRLALTGNLVDQTRYDAGDVVDIGE